MKIQFSANIFSNIESPQPVAKAGDQNMLDGEGRVCA